MRHGEERSHTEYTTEEMLLLKQRANPFAFVSRVLEDLAAASESAASRVRRAALRSLSHLPGALWAANGELKPLTQPRLRVKRYKIDGRPAFLAKLSRGSVFKTELYDDYYSLVWSSRVDLMEFERRLAERVHLDKAAAAVWEHGANGNEHIDSSEDGAPAGQADERPDFARFELPRQTYTWQSPSRAKSGRIGFLSDDWDEEFVSDLMTCTADAGVLRRLPDLLRRSRYVSRHLSRSSR